MFQIKLDCPRWTHQNLVHVFFYKRLRFLRSRPRFDKKVKKLAKKLEASNFPATEKNYYPFLRITQTNKVCTYVSIPILLNEVQTYICAYDLTKKFRLTLLVRILVKLRKFEFKNFETPKKLPKKLEASNFKLPKKLEASTQKWSLLWKKSVHFLN